MKLYSTADAAQALGITEQGIKYQVKRGNLACSKIGHSLVFTQEQLEAFQAIRRPRHRPIDPNSARQRRLRAKAQISA